MRGIGFGVLMVALVGCAPSSMDPGGGTGRGGPMPPALSDGGAGGGGGYCRGDGECGAGEVCSAGSVCIPAGTCAVDMDCADGHVCIGSSCEIGSECGTESFATEAIPPNFLIVLDRSCSMKRVVGTMTKWEAAIDSLVELTTRYSGEVRWGLTLFPDLDGGRCAQGDVAIPVADANEMAIQGLLTDALDPRDPYHCEAGPCVTNIDTAMEQALAEPAMGAPDRASYVLLVTDGKQSGSCRDGSDARTFDAVAALSDLGVSTFVVGFGDGVDADALSEFARLGGTARSGSPAYYQADDATGLLGAFDDIVAGVVSCDYSVAEMPDDLGRVSVFLDDTRRVEHDETQTDGWDYDRASGRLTFYGTPCDDLRSGAANDVDVVFGCAGPTLE